MRDRPGRGVLDHFGHGRIDMLSVASVLLIYTVAGAFLAFPTRVAKAGQTAAWTIPIFSGVLCILWLAPLVYVLGKHPGKTVVEVTRDLAGKTSAFVFGLAFFVFNTAMIASEARQLSEALATVVVPLTPITFIVFTICATGIYVALKGTEILGRLSIVTAVGTTLNVVLLSALTFHAWRLDEIYPLLGPGALDLAKVYGLNQPMYLELLAIGILAPYLRKIPDIGKSTWVAGVLSGVILSLVTLTCQMMFPYPSLTRVHLPFLRTIRIIYLSRFLQRFDVFFVVLWLSAGTLLVTIGAWIDAHLISGVTGLGSYRMGVLISGALVLVGALLFPSMTEAIVVHSQVIRPYSLFLMYGWPFTLLALQLIKEKKRRTGGGSGPNGHPPDPSSRIPECGGGRKTP